MKLLAKVGVFLVLGIALSYAQPAPEDAQQDGPAVSGDAAASAQLSYVDMVAQSKLTEQQIHKDHQYILHLRELARKEKDVIKLNCVNDKLVQVKPLTNIVEASLASLEASGGADNRLALYTEVTTGGERIRRLREEADQCVGEPTLATESESGFTAPEVPDSPFTDPFAPALEPPAYASPYN